MTISSDELWEMVECDPLKCQVSVGAQHSDVRVGLTTLPIRREFNLRTGVVRAQTPAIATPAITRSAMDEKIGQEKGGVIITGKTYLGCICVSKGQHALTVPEFRRRFCEDTGITFVSLYPGYIATTGLLREHIPFSDFSSLCSNCCFYENDIF
ncbi:hypothetical protein DITRI_Ditri01bG0153400 [Diplodiscus trichospermus]